MVTYVDEIVNICLDDFFVINYIIIVSYNLIFHDHNSYWISMKYFWTILLGHSITNNGMFRFSNLDNVGFMIKNDAFIRCIWNICGDMIDVRVGTVVIHILYSKCKWLKLVNSKSVCYNMLKQMWFVGVLVMISGSYLSMVAFKSFTNENKGNK